MPDLFDQLFWGMCVLLLDFLVWRLMGPDLFRPRAIVRTCLFAALTYVLFTGGMSPISPPAPSAALLRHLLELVLELVWWLQAAQLVTVLLDRVILPEWWRRERLFRDLLRAVVFLAAALASIAYVLDLPIRGLLATSGAVAIVLGLAIQSTLNDVFSGLVLNATEPFKIGDWVSIDDVEGQVAETNWRATSLLTGQGNLVVIPNSVAAKAKIVNNNEPSHLHGINITLQVAPEFRPARVCEALERTAASVSNVLATPKPMINVRKTTVDSIEYEIVCYVDTLAKKATTRNALYDHAHRHLASLGIDLRSLSIPNAGHQVLTHSQRLLRGVPMFGALEEGEFQALEQTLVYREFNAGDIIYSSLEAVPPYGLALYIIASGIVRVSLMQQEEETEFKRLAPGDTIGHSGVVSGLQYAGIARALTSVVTYRLNRSDLTPVIQGRPEVGRQMCQWLAEHHRNEGAFITAPTSHANAETSVFGWIKDGMHRLHNLVV